MKPTVFTHKTKIKKNQEFFIFLIDSSLKLLYKLKTTKGMVVFFIRLHKECLIDELFLRCKRRGNSGVMPRLINQAFFFHFRGFMFSAEALKESEVFTRDDFIESYDVGKHFKFLKIYSAYDKGRKSNKRRPLQEALTYPYIQPNSPYNISWFVFDIDRDFDVNEIFDKNLCTPNFIVINNENNHAQLWYKLRDPIWIQPKYKDCRAFKYQKAVYEAMRDVLDADRHFNRALCKNPFFYSDNDKNKKWSRVDFTRQEYSLIELCNHIDINFNSVSSGKNKISIDREDIETFSGAEKGSRNSSLFEHCRHEIYKHFAVTNCTESELLEWSQKYIEIQNECNNPPLEAKECEAMAKSIASWTFSNIQPCCAKKSKYDDKARERSLITRRKAKNKKIEKIKKLLKKNPDISNREIARRFGFSTNCVNDYVKEIKAQELRSEIACQNKKAEKANAVGSRFLMPEKNPACERFVNQFVCGDTTFSIALKIARGQQNGKAT